ncbi:MAG: hypothetical protein RBS46_01075 [Methyloversatilis sp.]|jgi:hypothetical protein|nr:hypothetical protein [Methyloversatilis sp.]
MNAPVEHCAARHDAAPRNDSGAQTLMGKGKPQFFDQAESG